MEKNWRFPTAVWRRAVPGVTQLVQGSLVHCKPLLDYLFGTSEQNMSSTPNVPPERLLPPTPLWPFVGSLTLRLTTL
jgi:hypothetical protein